MEITSLWFNFEILLNRGENTRTLFVCVLWHNHNSDRKNTKFIDRIHKSLSKKKSLIRIPRNWDTQRAIENVWDFVIASHNRLHYWSQRPALKWIPAHFTVETQMDHITFRVSITGCYHWLHLIRSFDLNISFAVFFRLIRSLLLFLSLSAWFSYQMKHICHGFDVRTSQIMNEREK